MPFNSNGVASYSLEDSFAIYTAHDGEIHFSNYQALFGGTIPAGTKASASVTLTSGEWSDWKFYRAIRSTNFLLHSFFKDDIIASVIRTDSIKSSLTLSKNSSGQMNAQSY